MSEQTPTTGQTQVELEPNNNPPGLLFAQKSTFFQGDCLTADVVSKYTTPEDEIRSKQTRKFLGKAICRRQGSHHRSIQLNLDKSLGVLSSSSLDDKRGWIRSGENTNFKIKSFPQSLAARVLARSFPQLLAARVLARAFLNR